MEEIKKGFKVYGKNFFRLILPFLALFVASLIYARYLSTGGRIFQTLSGLGLSLLGLISVCGVIVDTWGALEKKKFGLIRSWSYVFRNFPALLFTVSLAAIPWLVLLYLFLNFFSFFLFAPLAIYPFFFVFTLPELLIGGSGPIETFRNSFRLSLSHSTRTVLLTYLPTVAIISLTIIGFNSLTLLLIVPIWAVLTTTNYCSLNSNPGPGEYFTRFAEDHDR